MNEYESDAMWSRYGGTNGAVAFQTTYELLRAALPDPFLLGRVSYVDFAPPTSMPTSEETEKMQKDFMALLMADPPSFHDMRQNFHPLVYVLDKLGPKARDVLGADGADSAQDILEMLLSVFLQKRKAFEHERELRAIALASTFQPFEEFLVGPDNLPHPAFAGRWQTVEIPKLLQHIYVAPGARDSFIELLKRILSRYGMENVPVDRTSLDATPIF
jgi:hypothetical protein